MQPPKLEKVPKIHKFHGTEIEDDYDIRSIFISNSQGTIELIRRQFLPQGSLGSPSYYIDYETCSGAPGIGHWHTISLDPTWGSIVLIYEFDTMDGIDNSGAGWFIDSISIVGDLPSQSCVFTDINGCDSTHTLDLTINSKCKHSTPS